MDNFKKYLQSHIKELDVENPDAVIWQNINAQLPKKRILKLTPLFKYAVAASIIVIFCIGIGYQFSSNINDAVAKKNTGKETLSQKVQQKKDDDVVDVKEPSENVAATFNNKPMQTNRNTIIEKNENQEQYNNTLNNLEQNFKQVINLQKAKINSTPLFAEKPAYFSDFSNQMKLIEQDEKTIKAEIKIEGITDELLSQLINIYQQKLNVLKQLQVEINKTNRRFKINHNPIQISKTYFIHI